VCVCVWEMRIGDWSGGVLVNESKQECVCEEATVHVSTSLVMCMAACVCVCVYVCVCVRVCVYVCVCALGRRRIENDGWCVVKEDFSTRVCSHHTNTHTHRHAHTCTHTNMQTHKYTHTCTHDRSRSVQRGKHAKGRSASSPLYLPLFFISAEAFYGDINSLSPLLFSL